MVRKALIVEDEEDTGQILAEHLRRWGFEPTVLNEAKPAIPWVQQHHPDLILLDLLLPGMDGFSICERLKLEPDTNLIPIVMVTALTGHEDTSSAAWAVGPDAVKNPLTPGRAGRVVGNDEYAAFARRVLRAYARRVATGDVEALVLLTDLANEIDTAIGQAVTGLRAFGYSWAEIGSRLGITRQAAQQRWGHPA